MWNIVWNCFAVLGIVSFTGSMIVGLYAFLIGWPAESEEFHDESWY